MKSSLLTEVELLLIKQIWKNGPSTVREVHEQLAAPEKRAVTTVATFLNILVTKKFLYTTPAGRSHVFSAKVTKPQYQSIAISHLRQALFNNSSAAMIKAVVHSEEMTQSELAGIAELLESRLR